MIARLLEHFPAADEFEVARRVELMTEAEKREVLRLPREALRRRAAREPYVYDEDRDEDINPFWYH